jgi:carbon storage regulator CsrA
MLTVTRRAGERLFVGEDIVIQVYPHPNGPGFRVKVYAPKDVKIFREEIAPPELLAKHESHKA